MSAPFRRGQHVSIEGRGCHAVDSCVPADGGLYLLRLIEGETGDVFTLEIQQHRGVWRNEDLEAVKVESPGKGVGHAGAVKPATSRADAEQIDAARESEREAAEPAQLELW